MRARVGLAFVCSIIAVFCTASLGASQSGLGTGRVEGTVLDRSGAAIVDASVTAVNTASGVSTEQKTDSSGHFLFPYLSPGIYHVTIEKPGFEVTQVDNVVVEVGTTVTLRPQLSIGSVSSKVTVNADLPLVDTTRS
ncbi:MAG: hypothetical protein QOJ41_1070, partial [Acidobacteriaceae bacterium]|nr:hypothetical protein [Acidobacteriaceae bacterium]